MQTTVRSSPRRLSATVDHGAVYIGIADGVFLLLALWLTLATVTPAQYARANEGRPAITIKPDNGRPPGKTPNSEGGEARSPTHELDGVLVARGTPATDGALIVEVPYSVFQTLQQATSVRVISHK